VDYAIAIWVFIGLVSAFESAMMAWSVGKFYPMADLVVIPVLFALLGPIPLCARIMHRVMR
jgi:hypothetical protein